MSDATPVEHVKSDHLTRIGNNLGRIEVEPADEDCKSTEEQLLFRG